MQLVLVCIILTSPLASCPIVKVWFASGDQVCSFGFIPVQQSFVHSRCLIFVYLMRKFVLALSFVFG